mmetsp:Transcript_18248/g.37463  ORF Transcript_18248/g.37463 Transcript_18248/m.37463 type:complete len:249 (-) Transcript_18248:459-1205(-)
MFQQQYARHPVHKSQTPYLVVSFLSVSVSPTTGHQKAIAQHTSPQNLPPLLIPIVFQPPLHPLPLLLDRPRPTRPQGRLNHVFGMTRQNFFQGHSAKGAKCSEGGILFSLFLPFVQCPRRSAGEMPPGGAENEAAAAALPFRRSKLRADLPNWAELTPLPSRARKRWALWSFDFVVESNIAGRLTRKSAASILTSFTIESSACIKSGSSDRTSTRVLAATLSNRTFHHPSKVTDLFTTPRHKLSKVFV